MSKCYNCGEEGAHFVPPMCGDPGFFMCKPKDVCKTCGGEGEIDNSTSGIAMGGMSIVPCPTCMIKGETMSELKPRYEFDGEGIWDNKKDKKVVEVWRGKYDDAFKEREQLVNELLTLANRTPLPKSGEPKF